MTVLYRLAVPTDTVAWPIALKRAGISGAQFSNGTLEVHRALSADEVDSLSFQFESEDAADEVYRLIASAQESVLHQYTPQQLTKWLRAVVLDDDWLPLLVRDAEHEAALLLREIADAGGATFYMRIRDAVEDFITAFPLTARGLTAPVLQSVILLAGRFRVAAAIPKLREIMCSKRLGQMKLGNNTAVAIALRVWAGIVNEGSAHELEREVDNPVHAAACYDGLVSLRDDYRDRLFWRAAFAASRSVDITALPSVCATLLSKPSLNPVPWIAGYFRASFACALQGHVAILVELTKAVMRRAHLVTMRYNPPLFASRGSPAFGPCLSLLSASSVDPVRELLVVPRSICPYVSSVLPPFQLASNVTTQEACDMVFETIEHSG